MMAQRRRTSPAAYAVDLLVEAYTMGMTLANLPAEARPKNVRAGADLQARFAAALGLETAGWKIGCTSAAARTLLKAKEPFAGRVFLTRCFPSGATLPGAGYRTRGIEGEFAFVLGKDLKPRKRPYTRDEVAAAVADLHPAVEIVDSRFTDIKAVTLPELVADLGANGALVVGAPVKGWRRRDLAAVPVTMRAGGRIVGRGTGADALGHPLDALCWLANNPPSADGLRAGEIVSTGTCTGLHRADAADRVSCDFGPLGKVAFAFV
jgi:2-keto-4-pentenoate hydratase